jgi:putative FmdB family regulatory protein
MPTYEYKCESCGDSFTHSAAMADPSLQARPGCATGGCRLEKLISRCSAVIAGRNIVSALKEKAAAATPKDSGVSASAHACSYHCNHK